MAAVAHVDVACGFYHLLEYGDAGPDPPPVDLELGFAGPPGADAAAQPRQDPAPARQPGKEVRHLGEFDLEASFAGPRPLREDVQDERGAVEDLGAQLAFEVPLLSGGQLAVDDHEVRPRLAGARQDFLDLAASDERRRIGPG